MFAIFCKRRLILPRKDTCIFAAQQIWARENAVFVRSCSSSVCENASEETFNFSSYLINSCGLSSNDAVAASKKLGSVKSSQKPDAVLKLLGEYGFTDAHHIPKLISQWPDVLLASPNKTLLPKLQFLRSIGVLPVLAQNVSVYPNILKRSLQKSTIPLYNHLKSLLGSDKRVFLVFKRAPSSFGQCWDKRFSPNISMLRERGVPQSSIITLLMYQPLLLTLANEKLATYVDRAFAMGFDVSSSAFISALRVFHSLTESTLRQKKEIYRRCGWTESDIDAAFLRHPLCMNLSEKNITATMDFLVNELECKPAAVAQCPELLHYSLEKRIKPRCLVARILNEKGLKKMNRISTLVRMSEANFLEGYIVRYGKDIPELLNIYQGKLSPPDWAISVEK